MDETIQIPEQSYRKLTLMSSIAENTAQLALVIGAKGRILYANPACSHLLGYSSEQLHSFSVDSLFDFTDEQRSKLSSCLGTECWCCLETTARRRDGTTYPVQLTVSPLATDQVAEGKVLLASDVTVLRLAEHAVRVSEERHRDAVDLAPDGIAVLDLDGIVTSCNSAFLKLLDTTRDDILDQHFSQVPPLRSKAQSELEHLFGTILEGQASDPFEVSWPHRDGTLHRARVRARLLEHGDQPIGVQLVVRDITAQKREQERLHASEEKLRLIFDNAFDGISLYEELPDGTRVLVDCNDRYAEMAGRSKTELMAIGNTLPLQVSLEPMDTRDAFLGTLETGEAYRSRFTWLRPDGRENVIEYNAMPIIVDGKVLTIGFDRDVTERVRTERALREQRDFLDAVVEMASEGIFVSDLKGEMVVYNRRMREITGYTREEANTDYVALLFPDPTHRVPVNEAVEAALQGMETGAREWEIVRKDGEKRDVLVSIDRFAHGQRDLVMGVMRDITERKHAETALHSKTRQQEQLISTAQQLTASLDVHEVLRRIAAGASEILHAYGCVIYFLEEDGRTLTPAVVIDPEYEQEVLSTPLDVETSFTGQGVKSRRGLIFNDAGGSSIGQHIPGTPQDEQEHIIVAPLIINEDVLGAICVNRVTARFSGEDLALVETFAAYAVTALRNAQSHRDLQREVEERRRTDQALSHRLSMEELVTTLSTRFIHVGSGELEAEIRYALRAMGEFAGVDRCYLHLFSLDLRRIEQAYEWCAEGVEPREGKVKGLSTEHIKWALERKRRLETMYVPSVAALPPEAASERETWLSEGIKSVLSIPLTLGGAPIGALGFNSLRCEKQWEDGDVRLLGLVGNILSNVLTRQHAEQEKEDLEQRLERARLMESLGLLAGGVAHDLNNLLGPLVAYPELILDDLPEESPSREDVLRIQEAAEKAASVVQDLLTLARRGAYRMSPIDINVLIKEYVRSPSFSDLRTRHPDVSVNLDLAADLHVSGSDSHLTTAIMNLVTNAFEAMPDGGDLTIATSCESLDRPIEGYGHIAADDYVVLRVSDTGVGIAEADLPRIFEPFYTRKEMGRSGSGLGLAVVQGVVRDHRGQIDVQTRLGKGTAFALYLPITADLPAEEDKASIDCRGDETVLIVDDLKAQRDLAARLLTSLGYRVSIADSGRAAIDFLSEHSVDIVLLDMIMEDDFDGLDTYREIAQIHPDQKAVIASGYSETDRVRAAQALGAGVFLKKPYTLARLGQAIRQELDCDTDS